MSKFDSEVRAPGIAFKSATRTTPEYLGQTLIIIPLAAGVGIVVLIGWWFICLGTGWNKTDALFWAGATMIACVLFSFWRIWRDELYNAIEEITGHDWDGDGYIGEPPQIQEFNYQQSERTSWRASLPAPEPVIRDWARAALSGGDSLSYAAWQKRFSTRPNYGDGADNYRKFRQALVQAGWAVEQGTHSISLTDRGQEALEEWLHQHPDPVPLLEADPPTA